MFRSTWVIFRQQLPYVFSYNILVWIWPMWVETCGFSKHRKLSCVEGRLRAWVGFEISDFPAKSLYSKFRHQHRSVYIATPSTSVYWYKRSFLSRTQQKQLKFRRYLIIVRKILVTVKDTSPRAIIAENNYPTIKKWSDTSSLNLADNKEYLRRSTGYPTKQSFKNSTSTRLSCSLKLLFHSIPHEL